MKRPWLILLIFPAIGLFGMTLILISNQAAAPPVLQALPTPIPLKTTPVPTVTVVPILDNLAPDLPLTDFEGNRFKLSDLTGKIVVINFWATWCPPCVEEMPTLQQFAAENSQVVVLGVTDPEDGQTVEAVQAFIEEYHLTALEFGLDKHGLLRINFNAMNLPMTFVLDQQGYVRFRQIGAVTTEDLQYYLSELS